MNYIGQPVLSISTTAEGLKVSWNKVNGAAKYRVFKKNTDGKWEKLADTASISYTDKTVKDGFSYTYTVRCITSDGKSYTSSYDTKGVTATYKHTHNYTSKVTKAATCDETGIRTYTCPCGDSYTEVIPALDHDWEDLTEKQWVVDGKVWVVDKEAYDEEVQVGYDKYYECNGCGARFEDSADAEDHLFECPTPSGGYSLVKKPIYETVHHDEEGHYEETGHYETVVTGRKCSRCGLEEKN